MPLFSIVIPTYKNAEFLGGCLDSIRSQTFEDWEAIVVVDGSPDDSANIAMGYAELDDRVKVINKTSNEGTHLARRSGVLTSTGDYVYLLDADDQLPLDCLAQLADVVTNTDADMIHYGIRTIGVDISDAERIGFENYINKPMSSLMGPDIRDAAFDARRGYLQDWRVTQRVYSSSLIKRAFEEMTTDRLGRAQDGYEYFVISSIARKQITVNDVVALDYFYGRGENGDRLLEPSDFLRSARDFQATIDAILEFAKTQSHASAAAEGARVKLTELLMNDWHVRLTREDKLSCLDELAKVIGTENLACELCRFARDEAYDAWVNGYEIATDAPLRIWLSAAESLVSEAAECSNRYDALHDAAASHLKSVDGRTAKFESYSKQGIRIFVSTHKDVDRFDSDILQPVQVGSSRAKSHLPYALRDDSGDNISDLNPMYCELTTQYWAWKNAEADYYGFCHYRRYFDFNDERHEENEYGEIMAGSINAAAQAKYCLDDASIKKCVEGYDVITTEIKDLREFPGEVHTPDAQYKAAPRLLYKDLGHVIAILKEMHPEYADDADAFLSGHRSCFCNMFIMRKEIFFEYCEWLFPILERFVSETDMSHYSKEALRTPGHLSERLFNIFYQHHLRIGSGWKTCQLQCVHFEYPDRTEDFGPAQFADERHVVPVVLAADNGYVPMLTTTLLSMVENASSDYNYDVVIFQKDIDWRRQDLVRKFFSKYSNVSVRFLNVKRVIDGYDLRTNNDHISIETYYRFLIQELLPFYDKVLYLDSDLIVRGDVSELFKTELGNNLIGAVRDIDFAGNLNMNDGERMEYARTVLEMANPYDYFQAGVLLLNTAELRKLKSVSEWMSIVSGSEYIYDDQDVLNKYCDGRVTFLDDAWNVMIDCDNRVARVFSFAPSDQFDSFQVAAANPLIVHYAGYEKPWKMALCDQGTLYWNYARRTPFYEELLVSEPPSGPAIALPNRAIGEGNPLRKIMDPLMPVGSQRREAVKAVVRGLRGRR